jgi:transcriptional regulator with XRE-family HTH domain
MLYIVFYYVNKIMNYRSLHFRLARNCLKITQKKIEEATKISVSTICRLELEDKEVDRASFSTLKKLIQFYQEREVIFLIKGEDGAKYDGVMYKN